MNYREKEIERGFTSDEGQKWIEDLYGMPNSWESNSSKLARIFGRICIFKIGLNAVRQEDLQLLDSLALRNPNDESYEAYNKVIDREPDIRWLEEFTDMVELDIVRRINNSGDSRLIYETNSKAKMLELALSGEETNITVSEEDFKQISDILIDVQASSYTRRYLGFIL